MRLVEVEVLTQAAPEPPVGLAVEQVTIQLETDQEALEQLAKETKAVMVLFQAALAALVAVVVDEMKKDRHQLIPAKQAEAAMEESAL
jgi:phenylpyruvate tautomerase PptA (4-oxalocrotonate tautomerase family)